MKNIINEISRIKKLMSLKEQTENISGTVIIGDYIAELMSRDVQTIPHLVDETMTVNQLVKSLSSSEPYESVENLLVSVGTVDFFKGINSIKILCDLIEEVFPNANLFVVKGIIEDIEFTDEKEILEIENAGNVFYDEFEICGFEVIGNLPIISDSPIGYANPTIQELVEFVNELDIDPSLVSSEVGLDTLKPKRTNIKIGGDETDFDTIYEFLERFEEIIKSGNIYDESIGSGFESDIDQIKIALNFVTKGDGEDLVLDGKIDQQMIDDLETFQSRMGLEVTGIADPETLEELFYELKVESFNDDDLAMFLGKVKEEEYFLNGVVDISGAGLDSEQKSNVELLIQVMKDKGITNPYAQIGVLSVIGKECNFIPKNEVCYNTTDNSRIREVFGSCRLGDLDESELTLLKKDCNAFFDKVYGPDATACLGWDTGNDQPGDGYKYRGRGFNQITFKHNYQKYGDKIGMNLVSDPDQLNDVQTAAEAAVAFLTKGQSIPEFKDKKTATDYFVNVNAGGHSGRSEGFKNSHEWMEKFEVKPY